jgi:hypothetical protein
MLTDGETYNSCRMYPIHLVNIVPERKSILNYGASPIAAVACQQDLYIYIDDAEDIYIYMVKEKEREREGGRDR